jgi:hypothetical protein
MDGDGAESGQHYESLNERVIAGSTCLAAAARRRIRRAALADAPVRGDHDSVITRRRRMTFGPGETDPSQIHRGDGAFAAAPQPPCVTFERRELDRILGLYGRMVAAGEWRDYAIDFLRDRAIFSVFRHAAEVPIYRIEKNPKLARRQGAYSVITATGLIMRRGPDLERVLRVFDGMMLKLVRN